VSEPWNPHPYQKGAVKWLLEHPEGGLLLDPGLGKTSCVYAATKLLKRAKLLIGTLVIAPKRVVREVWPLERDKWEDFADVSIGILHGDRKDTVLHEKHDFYIMTPEGLEWLLKSKLGRPTPWSILRKKVDTLVVDESSAFKNRTQRFTRIRGMLPRFRRRWILTGSLAPNGYLDVFRQVYIADMGRLLGYALTRYKQEYFVQGGYGGYDWYVSDRGRKEIPLKLRKSFLRLDADDYLKLPQLINITIPVTLPPEARKVYDRMEHAYFSVLDSGSVTAVNAGAALIKCRQVAAGGVYMDDDFDERKVAHLHDVKTDALLNLIEELNGQPLLIFYSFQHDVTRMKAALGEALPVLGGGTSDKQARVLLQAWNAGRYPWMAAHPKTAGHGLNMQEGDCAHVAWYSLDYNYELYDQAIRRVRRQGNKAKQVMNYHIIAEDTIDGIIVNTLINKGKTQAELLGAIKAYRFKR
jgi:SNF2 family DNA or RNA helicase